ncbi:MAG: bifunctional adenosylcobinamide kinase/adenosylcobinamide-phosphate guanylyltransferase [Treponemataceae bacterium]|nr:bifunctional adenosylcobinamide kinase/adenosylcobinamide-phosphate guanylyltransferase [Treponemataceae bacterium]
MELIIGGYAQGMLEYALSLHPGAVVYDENNYRKLLSVGMPSAADAAAGDEGEEQALIWNNFHLAVRREFADGKKEHDISSFVEALVEKLPDIVIVSDEIGCGIVPMNAHDRRYRELTGRLQCLLAEKAEKVFRIVCGIAQRIK